MELFGLLWQVLAFVIMAIFEKVAYVVDDIMFKVVKVRSFKPYPRPDPRRDLIG